MNGASTCLILDQTGHTVKRFPLLAGFSRNGSQLLLRLPLH